MPVPVVILIAVVGVLAEAGGLDPFAPDSSPAAPQGQE